MCEENLAAVAWIYPKQFRNFIYDMMGFMALSILLLQIYEWGAMLYLVKS